MMVAPRSTTPGRGTRTPGRVGGSWGGATGRDRELEELKATVRHQGEIIEKQGSLLLGHAQLLHEMREELLALRSNTGASHTKQLTQLATTTLKNLSATVEAVQRETQRNERNITTVAKHMGVVLEEAKEGDKLFSPGGRSEVNVDLDLFDLEVEGERAPVVSPNDCTVSHADGDDSVRQPAPAYTQRPMDAAERTPLAAARGAPREGGIGSDLYSRGLAQMRKRQADIEQKQKAAEAEDMRKLRNPNITNLARRSRSSDKPISTRADEWKEKRERKRETLRSEMQKLEESNLRATPYMNPKSAKIVNASAQISREGRRASVSAQHVNERSVSPRRGRSPHGKTPSAPVPEPSYETASPPPLDELLQKLRKRREMLGLTTSDAPLDAAHPASPPMI